MDLRAGQFSGDPVGTQALLDRVLDRASGRVKLPRRGRIWEAVATARTRGATGAGRLVAIIDGGFDITVPGLTNRLHPASVIRGDTVAQTAGHGTAVALLVREVAPECELLLVDVTSQPLRGQDVGDAIDLARTNDADVINLSLEFPTDCALQDTSWIRTDLLTSGSPPIDGYIAQVQAWIDHAEPYDGARCSSTCAVCDALAAVPEPTLVVAASGNRGTQSCPACFGRVVGVGFHRTRRIEVAGSIFTTSEAPFTKAPMSRAELLVEEPPGFLGTSFAAPLLSGLGALAPEPAILADLAKLSRALTPILALANSQWILGADALPDDAPQSLHRGLLTFADAMPPAHRHFDQEWIREPCAECTLLLIDWYDVFVSLLAATGTWEPALGIARIAAVLAPETASVSGNYGLSAERAAHGSTDEIDRQTRLHEAVAAYANAVRLAPEANMYTTSLERLSQKIEVGTE